MLLGGFVNVGCMRDECVSAVSLPVSIELDQLVSQGPRSR